MTKITIDRQAIQAMDAADARLGLDKLNALTNDIEAAKKILQGIIEQPLTGHDNEEAAVFFSRNGSGHTPTPDITNHIKGLRKGKWWRLERYIQVDPVFVVCVGNPGQDFENRYRVVDSAETAKGVLLLHNLI